MNQIFKNMIKEALEPFELTLRDIYLNSEDEQEKEKIRLGALMIEKIAFMIAGDTLVKAHPLIEKIRNNELPTLEDWCGYTGFGK